MAPEENEAVTDYGLRALEGATIVPIEMTLPNRVGPVLSWHGKSYNPALTGSVRLKPSATIEAFYVCKFIKEL
jgi:16S rRNA C967 or C1407 C5-methylase (RsmB/RsmF family)